LLGAAPLRRRGQKCLCFADEARRVHGPEETKCLPELVVSLSRPLGPGEFLSSAKPDEGG